MPLDKTDPAAIMLTEDLVDAGIIIQCPVEGIGTVEAVDIAPDYGGVFYLTVKWESGKKETGWWSWYANCYYIGREECL